ncbi:surface antigen-domain-containing protein [Auriculariales sp. MPI-PUGE-AT-0066]|nr:surface antigen-domain-containing protein [Auriculariales sp. MPI-PUGE-AT-0066]
MDDEEERLLSRSLTGPLANSSAPRDKEPAQDELDQLLKWQEERMKRRMQGEYESATMRMAELVNGNIDAAGHVSSVRILGASATRPGFLKALITPHIASAETFGDSMHATRRIVNSLARTDVFSNISPTLHLASSPFANPGDVDVLVHVKERGRFLFRTMTELGNGEGSVSATGRVLNAFGGAETLEANISSGTKTKRLFTATMTVPLAVTDLRTAAELTAYGWHRDNEVWASSHEELQGIKLALKHVVGYGSHELAYEVAQRNICNLTPTASLSIREQARPTVKSAVSHSFTYDTRVETPSGRLGAYFKVSEELAGLGLQGDAVHAKGEVISQLGRVIFPGLVASVGLRGGILCSLNDKPSLYSDRFQLGGPLTVRSMRHGGLGPRDGPDALGGDLYWAAGASLIADIPRRPQWPLKTHAFLNAGRLDALRRRPGQPLIDDIRASLGMPSITAGVGLIFTHGPARAEINFGVPLVAAQSDRLVRGMQFSVGLDFL